MGNASFVDLGQRIEALLTAPEFSPAQKSDMRRSLNLYTDTLTKLEYQVQRLESELRDKRAEADERAGMAES